MIRARRLSFLRVAASSNKAFQRSAACGAPLNLMVASEKTMVPTIVRDGSFRLFFFLREEPRMHVHVAHPDGEAKFWLEPGVHWLDTPVCHRRSCQEPKTLFSVIFTRSSMPGTRTLAVDVTHISKHGVWLLLEDEELLLPFSHFPWFRQATVDQLCDVEWPTRDHLYWRQLDVDLSVESIRNAERFPLVSKASANTALQTDTPQAARP